jgi:aspartyl-tRNA(Asn)/glutamyl-tRNA(Gln) amidotransferase subunit B
MIDISDKVKAVIGLEIHVELATATKMFCRCRNRFGDKPNTNVCPVCLGMPGSLPVMNARAVELAMRVGLALGCEVSALTKWDRKSYYYPDLPKNYQISQYDMPLSRSGSLEIALSDGTTRAIRVLRAHLEEDAGKNVHDNPTHTCVDLNRAGVPLLEIVSEPDMNTVEEVMAYSRGMHRLVRWLGVSQANMQMGHMRFEPNINLHVERGGRLYKTPITEVKNLNSFRSLERTVEYEIARQYEQWQADPEGYALGKKDKENRGFDDARGVTVFQREKEESHDYRYFPDPDLAPVAVDEAWRREVAARIGELPLARRGRYIRDYGLTFKEADALTQDAATGALLDEAVAGAADAKRCTNLLMGRGAAIANERGCAIAEIGVTSAQLAELAKMLAGGKLNATSAAKVFDRMIETGGSPGRIAQAEGLLSMTDVGAIAAWVDEAVASNPQAVKDVMEGGKKAKRAFGFLMGRVMQRSGSAAPPAEVQRLLRRKLGK